MSDNNKLNIIIETKELVHALTFANSIVEKRNVISELGNIKLSAKGNFLEIVATDMDLALSQNLGAQIINEGATTVSTSLLSDIMRKIIDKEIRIKQAEQSEELEIIGKNCYFRLLTLPADQFPNIEEVKADVVLKVPCKDFARIIDYTHFSMSTEETRYNLNGIYLHLKDKKFLAAATDGHRLSMTYVLLNNEIKEFGVILPRKTVQEIMKIIKDTKNIQADIEISLGINKIKFNCNNIVMVSKLIDGIFPEYNAFIPHSNPNKLSINSKILADAIERVATVTIDKFRAIKMSINKEGLEITASGEARGAAKEKLITSEDEDALCDYNGNEELVIGFNPKYILDVLYAINKNSKVEFYFNDSFSPVLIKIKDSVNDNFIIMPVKV